eukprot:747034-Hanusia_phi.AAC.7
MLVRLHLLGIRNVTADHGDHQGAEKLHSLYSDAQCGEVDGDVTLQISWGSRRASSAFFLRRQVECRSDK